MINYLLRILGIIFLGIYFIVTFLFDEYIDYREILNRLAEKCRNCPHRELEKKAKRILKSRRLILSIIYLIGLVLLTAF